MANGFPAKAEAAPTKRLKATYYACESCAAPLVGQWVTRDGGKIRNPEDDTNHCFKCAGYVAVEEIKPAEPTHYLLVFGLGVLAFPLLWWGVPMVWRMLW